MKTVLLTFEKSQRQLTENYMLQQIKSVNLKNKLKGSKNSERKDWAKKR